MGDLGALPAHLAPRGAGVLASGELTIQGIGVEELAERFGTPLFVYDEDDIRARVHDLAHAIAPVQITYASKAFSAVAMAKVVASEGLWWDAASLGELEAAVRGGVPPERIIVHGNNKSFEELERAASYSVGRIVVDAIEDLDRLDALGVRQIPLWLRVAPGIEAHTHAFVRTGQVDSKFGLPIVDGTAERAYRRAVEAGFTVTGVHAHIGSQIFDLAPFGELVHRLSTLRHRWAVPELCVGGGLGVPYLAQERAPTLSEWGSYVREALRGTSADPADVFVEPGRAIVASSCITLYRVGVIKRIPGVRIYVAVDGGMSDNPRPVLYGSGYMAVAASRLYAAHDTAMRVVGKHCESGDVLVDEALLPSDLSVGELIATPVTGAYGYSMGSNYNRLPRPAVVMIRGGRAREVVRREQLDDLFRLEVGA